MLSKLKSLKWPGTKSSADASESKTDKKPAAKAPGSDIRLPNDRQNNASAVSAANARAALNDPSEKKRLAAIGNLTSIGNSDDIDLLQSAALRDHSKKVRDSAARQYAKHLADDSATRTLLESYANSAEKRDLAVAITAHHKDAELREYGLSLFSEEADLCNIALETRFHDSRVLATQKLTSIDAIDKCWRGLKSKDKVVARTLKARLDEERDSEQQKLQQKETSRKIVDEMERLATGTWSPNYTTRFELFDQQWQQLSFKPELADSEKFQSMRQIAADKVAANRERQKKHDDCIAITNEVIHLRDGLVESGLDALVKQCEPTRQSFNDCKSRWRRTDKDFDGFRDLEQGFEQASRSLKVRLQQASTVADAVNAMHPHPDTTSGAATPAATDKTNNTASAESTDANVQHDADANTGDVKQNSNTDTDTENDRASVSEKIRTQEPRAQVQSAQVQSAQTQSAKRKSQPDLNTSIKKLTALHDWFKQGDDKTAYAAELPQLIARLKKEASDRHESRVALQNAIGRQFASLNSALASKRWGPARSIHERLSNKINRLPDSDKPRYQDKLSRLEVRLNELGDWKQFATEPKLISLCEQMEKIPEHGLAPRDQADRIKALQQQWKSMGASPALEQYWPRFKTAADTAYEPCAKYFAEKRQEKNTKLKRRSDVCEMLESYLEKSDWEKAEWKLVEKTLRTAKMEWRNTRVFDRKASAELDQRFTGIVDALNEKLAPAYDAGAQEKIELIEKVKALAEGDINQHCINQVKRLQGLWRRTGITRQKDDRKLWSEFNQHCSDIFSRHRGQQKEQYAASIQHVTRGKEIIRELKQMAAATAVIDEKALQKLQDEFQSLPEFPERDSKYLFRDFGRAVDGVETQIQKFGENSRSAELARISHNAAICSMLEKLIDQPTEDARTESERLLADWDNGEKTDSSEWKKAISHRRDTVVEHLNSNTQPDYEEHTLKRRLLCIDAEILKDKPTPTDDRDLRMQHQLNKLQTGDRGNINYSVDEEATNLRIAWLTALPASPAATEALEQRFNTALDD